MVLGLVAHRVPRSGLGTRRQTGCSPANSCGTVLLPYPRSLAQDVPFSSQPGNPHLRNPQPGSTARLAGARTGGDAGKRYSRPGAPRPISLTCRHKACRNGAGGTGRRMEEREALRDSWTFGGYQSSADQFRPRGGPLYRVDGPSGFTQAAENHGRTISERHNRTPQRRAWRV